MKSSEKLFFCPPCRFCGRTTGQVHSGSVSANGNPRYKCGSCGRRYSVPTGSRGYPAAVRERAAQLRKSGLGIRAIARELDVNPQSVANWLREITPLTPPPLALDALSNVDREGAVDTAAPAVIKRRITITDVARRAGVSNSTVSNYLNDKGSMSPETRLRVREAVEALQFTPSALVHAIRNRKTGIIGVILFGLDTLDVSVEQSIAPPILAGINAAADAAEYNVLLYTGWSDRPRQQPGLSYLDGHIDGLLWIAPRWEEAILERIARAGLPTVTVLSRHVPPGVGYVNGDNENAIHQVISHLYGLGHRRIAYAGPMHDSNFRDRRDAYRLALERIGLPFDPALEFIDSDFFWARPTYRRALDAWLALDEPPTAIALPDDGLADYFIAELTRRGLRVPEDFAVTGVNDLPDARRIGGGLTTIRQPFREMGRLGVELLLALMGGATEEACRVTVPVELVIRQTSGEGVLLR